MQYYKFACDYVFDILSDAEHYIDLIFAKI